MQSSHEDWVRQNHSQGGTDCAVILKPALGVVGLIQGPLYAQVSLTY